MSGIVLHYCEQAVMEPQKAAARAALETATRNEKRPRDEEGDAHDQALSEAQLKVCTRLLVVLPLQGGVLTPSG